MSRQVPVRINKEVITFEGGLDYRKNKVSVFNPKFTYECDNRLYISVQNRLWRWKILEDEFIYNIIKEGLKLKFENIDRVKSLLTTEVEERSVGRRQKVIIESCVNEFLELQLIERIDHNTAIFNNHVFVVSSDVRTTKYRLILDMKVLNKEIVSEKFSMWNVEKLLPYISTASFAGVIDISKAYCHVPLHRSTTCYLAFSFNGVKYSYKCMPFGLKTAPFYFTRLMKSVLAFLRDKFAIQVFAYLDDLLVLGNSFEQTHKDLSLTLNFLKFLGFKLNPKSSMVPVSTVQYLGVMFDLHNKTMFNTDQNIEKVQTSIKNLIHRNTISKREVERILGLLNFVCNFIKDSRWYMHGIIKFLCTLNRTQRDLQVQFPQNVKDALKFWTEDVNLEKVPLGQLAQSITVYSDASKKAWGGVISMDASTQDFNGQWSPQVRKFHINLKELLAVKETMLALPEIVCNLHIQWYLDNTSAIAWLRKEGSHKNDRVNQIVFQIKELQNSRRVTVKYNFIPSLQNSSADLLSRSSHCMPGNLQVSGKLFAKVCRKMNISPSIDLFADPSSFKVQRYVSSIPSRAAVALNALTYHWGGGKELYAFPPIELLGKVLHKWKKEGTGRLLLIAPEWNSQPYMALLRRQTLKRYRLPLNKQDLFVETLQERCYVQNPYVFKLTGFLL